MVWQFIPADHLPPLLQCGRALLAGRRLRLYRPRRRPVRDGEPPCAGGALFRQYAVGILQRRGAPLASVDVALAHAGLPTLRAGTRRPSFYEPAPACDQYAPRVRCAHEDDEGSVAERDRGGTVRLAPVARRICRLGSGT